MSDTAEGFRRDIDSLVETVLGAPRSADARHRNRLVEEMALTALHLASDETDLGQLRLVRTALREMRAGYRVFNRWRHVRKVSVFGSARTDPAHPDYAAAREFGQLMTTMGWMTITGAGGGIMHAAHEGSSRPKAFGLSIRLPAEERANTVIHGDDKLIEFRYFFTRKLMFMSHAQAVAVFPGGFGTMDEIFEALTLVQTGRSSPMPIVLIEGAGDSRGYWRPIMDAIGTAFLRDRFISPNDMVLLEICPTPLEAVATIARFYSRYHSSRYVGDQFVIRMTKPLSADHLAEIARDFRGLSTDGEFAQCAALPEEQEHPELPRLVYRSTRRDFAQVRMLINRLNSYPWGDE